MTRSRVSSDKEMARGAGACFGIHDVETRWSIARRCGPAGDLDPLGFFQDLRRQLGDVARHGGREQQRLALLGHGGDDARTSVDEAHVSMRSASSRTRNVTWPDRTLPTLIRSSRRPGVATRMSTPRGGLDLAAEDHGRRRRFSDRRRRPSLDRRCRSCRRSGRGQLAGRRQHQGPRALGLWALAFAGEVLQHGQRRRLPSCRCRSGRCRERRDPAAAPGWCAPGSASAPCAQRHRGHATAARREPRSADETLLTEI